MTEEHAEIDHGVNVFAEWMKKRMLTKASKGFTGWKEPQDYEIKERLLEKAEQVATAENISDKDLVDIANFSMMLFMARWKKTFPFEYDDAT